MGASELNPKQLRFAVAYLNSGNAKQAAETAGYSAESAEKVRRTPVISRFLHAALKTVSQNGDQLVVRKFELSVSYHSELQELRAKKLEEKTEKELRREAQVALMAHRNDMLLGMLLGRLGVKLSGEVTVNPGATGGGDFIVIPPDALAGFAAARAEVAATNRLAAASGQGRN